MAHFKYLIGCRPGLPTIVVISLVVIAAISVHDAMLLVLTDQVIQDTEQNPIGTWLIGVGGGEVWLFMAIKLAGTATVCTVIASMFPRWPEHTLIVAGSLVCFQGVLLTYLLC